MSQEYVNWGQDIAIKCFKTLITKASD